MRTINDIAWFYGLISRAIGVGFIIEIGLGMLPDPAVASTANQLRICQNAIAGLTGLSSSRIKVSASIDNDQIVRPNLVDATVAGESTLPSGTVVELASNIGRCEFSSSDELIKIDTFFYSGQSPRDFKDFGDFSGLGRYVAIVRQVSHREIGSSYLLLYSQAGQENIDDIFFPVLLNDKKEWWWVDCPTKTIGRLNSGGMKELPPTPPNSLTTAVSNFVCTQ